MYVKPHNRASKYMVSKLTRLKGEINHLTVIVGDFNVPLSINDITTRQKINRDI